MTDTRYRSRKFLLALVTLIVCSVMTWFKLLDANTFKDIVLGTVGAYILGNVAQAALVKPAAASPAP